MADYSFYRNIQSIPASNFNRFSPFPVGVHSDALTKKGVLYARIRLPKGYVNIFTTHTQSTYVCKNEEELLPSYVTRIHQLSLMKTFVFKKLMKNASPTDLNIILGDFNVNANNNNYPLEKVLSYCENGSSILNSINNKKMNEYELMMILFNGTQRNYVVRDCMYEKHQTFKITYGDVLVDEKLPRVGLIGEGFDTSS